MTVAAAVGVNLADSEADATIPDGLTITAPGTLTVSAQNTTGGTAAATGVASGTAKDSVGAAVALNLVKSRSLGAIGAGTTINAGAITVGAQQWMASGVETPSTYGATATAGAGGTDVGVAGGLAINLVSASSQATIGQSYAIPPATSGATVTITSGGTGAVSLTAEEDANSTVSAMPAPGSPSSGGSVGVGASLGLDIVSNTALAELADNVMMTGAGATSLSATSLDTMSTTAEAGAAGGIAVSPAVALSLASNTTTAEVGTGGTLTVGSLSATATHTSATSSTSGGTAMGTGSAAVGAAIALNIATDQTTATTLRNITATGSGGVSFIANASSASAANATASASGGETNTQESSQPQSSENTSEEGPNSDTKDSNSVDGQNAKQRNFADSEGDSSGVGDSKGKAATPSASTSDGGVTVAAAVAVNIADSQADATVPAGLTITDSGGPLTVTATNDTGSSANPVYGDTATASGAASATAGNTKAGIGAAVALNLVDASTEATIQAATIDTDGVIVNAGMLGTTPMNVYGASATSGAGSGAGQTDIGVAGSLAINIVNNTSQALIETGASVTADNDTGSVAGTVSITSLNNSTDTTSALPVPGSVATGGEAGVGASLALNIISDTTQSELQQNAGLTGAAGLTVTASSNHTITTTATNGASGKIGIGAGIAIVIASDMTTASVGSDSATPLVLAGGSHDRSEWVVLGELAGRRHGRYQRRRRGRGFGGRKRVAGLVPRRVGPQRHGRRPHQRDGESGDVVQSGRRHRQRERLARAAVVVLLFFASPCIHRQQRDRGPGDVEPVQLRRHGGGLGRSDGQQCHGYRRYDQGQGTPEIQRRDHLAFELGHDQGGHQKRDAGGSRGGRRRQRPFDQHGRVDRQRSHRDNDQRLALGPNRQPGHRPGPGRRACRRRDRVQGYGQPELDRRRRVP